MQDRYWMFQHKGTFYVQDKLNGKQKSLRTRDPAAARRMFAGMNQRAEQPLMNLAMAKVYLSAKSEVMLERTWNDVLVDMEQSYRGPTLVRWRKVMKSAPFALLRSLRLLHTESTDFLAVLRHPRAGNSTQKFLRIVHNRALDLGWILAPVMARRLWPKLRSKRPKAVTVEQHHTLIAAVKDPEFRHFLQMLWEIGGSQTDTARLHWDNIDLVNRRLTYTRQKLESVDQGSVVIAIGDGLMALLRELPQQGYLFPHLAPQAEVTRASRFRKIANRLGFTKISLHGYRYAWAQRAKSFGMPLREAMAHLGHGSKIIHHTYSPKRKWSASPSSSTRSNGRKKSSSSLRALQPDPTGGVRSSIRGA